MKRHFFFFCAMASFHVSAAAPWGLCPGTPVTGQIPCDTQCFGPAGTNLGSTYVEAETALQNAFNENTNSWVSANDTFIDYVGNYYSQAQSSNTKRIRALDGVAKGVTLSLELLSETRSRSINNFVNSYRQIHSDIRTADLVRDNSKNYISKYNSPTGVYLLSNIDEHANNLQRQKKLNAINNIQDNKKDFLSLNQQAIMLSQPNNAGAGDLSINDFDDFIVEGEVNNEKLEVALQSIYTIYFNEVIDSNTLSNKRKAIKMGVALDSLMKTLRFIDEDTKIKAIEDDLYNQHFNAYVSGANTVALHHALKQEHIYQKAVENNLLNSYFKQVKTNNALKVISNR